jgi:hypothetical protein
MKKLGAALLISLWLASAALAQNFTMPPPAGVQVGGFAVVSSCGGQSLSATQAFGTMDTTGKLCVNATVSATVSGFTPNGNYANLTATASSASVALPTGATVLFQNTGTTAVSCTLGVGSATAVASEIIIQSGSSRPLVVGSNTFGACIDQTGSASNLVALAGGTGLDTGYGGGGSGGGGGAVTLASGAVASGAYSSGSYAAGALAAGAFATGAAVDGWDLTQGAIADAAVTAGATGSLSAKLRSISRDVTTVNTWAGGTLGAMANYGTSPGAVLVPGANVFVTGAVGLTAGSNTSGQTGSLIMVATTAANPTYTTAQTNYASSDVKGNVRVVLGGGIPETASATGTTAATTATLATAAATTTYICGFSIRANATAAATGNATVTGTITGTLNFTQWTAPLASGLGVTEETFTPCIPASAVNTSIAVVSAAPGTGGVVSVSAWGYQQ